MEVLAEVLAGEPRALQAGMESLEMWGWSCQRVLPLIRGDQHGVPAWRVPVPLLATVDWQYE